MNRLTKILLALFCLVFAVAAFLYLHSVSLSITDEDSVYIQKIIEEAGVSDKAFQNKEDFADEIAAIQAIQYSAFHTTPEVEVIKTRSPREPKNIYESNAAFCGDRSRYMHKAFRTLGFSVRYASLYAKTSDRSVVETLLSSRAEGAESHALLEVKTSKGWMIVDSRSFWISLTKDGDVISLKDLQNKIARNEIPEWSELNKDAPYPLLEKSYYIIYGLYSRHGLFYEPYTPYVPDMNWSEFMLNFSDGF